ncbi:hypothetical protein [Paenibacillus sp. OV219]|nr:hypothetical protein [Paenibacillus sp. OV219]SEO50620.1 hypothetical protein SAMN05518847_108108 [Paenibacillus sp. OV219]
MAILFGKAGVPVKAGASLRDKLIADERIRHQWKVKLMINRAVRIALPG